MVWLLPLRTTRRREVIMMLKKSRRVVPTTTTWHCAQRAGSSRNCFTTRWCRRRSRPRRRRFMTRFRHPHGSGASGAFCGRAVPSAGDVVATQPYTYRDAVPARPILVIDPATGTAFCVFRRRDVARLRARPEEARARTEADRSGPSMRLSTDIQSHGELWPDPDRLSQAPTRPRDQIFAAGRRRRNESVRAFAFGARITACSHTPAAAHLRGLRAGRWDAPTRRRAASALACALSKAARRPRAGTRPSSTGGRPSLVPSPGML